MVALARPHIAPRIRVANSADLGELRRLLDASGYVAARNQPKYGARKHLLVIDAPDGRSLAAAAQLIIEGRTARMTFVAVGPRFVQLGFGDHLVRFAESVARGLGVRTFRSPR